MSTRKSSLAYELATLETRLCELEDTCSAMLAVCGLVKDALHTGHKAQGETFDPSSVCYMGYEALEYIARRASVQIVRTTDQFRKATKGDGTVGAELDAIHAATPLGHVWTGESYPEE